MRHAQVGAEQVDDGLPVLRVVLHQALQGIDAASRTGALLLPGWSAALPYSSVTRHSVAPWSFCSSSSSTERCLRAASSSAAPPAAPITMLDPVRRASRRWVSSGRPVPTSYHSSAADTTATATPPR
jgi:hypothetical protein